MASVPPPSDVPARESARVGRWRLWMAPAAIVLGLGLGQIGVIVVALLGEAAGGSTLHHPSAAVSLISDLVADLAFVVAALYFTVRAGRARPGDFGFRRTAAPAGAGLALLAGIGYYVLTWIYASLLHLHGKDKLPSELGVSHSTAALAGAAVFVCVIAPVAEEFFFRGFLFGLLSQWRLRLGGQDRGPWAAAIVVGILFGLAHTGSASPQYLIPLGLLGFVLCLLRWRCGSLYPCMALHSFNNSLALGVNQLHWPALSILGLITGSLLVIGALTGPLAPAPRLDAQTA